MAGHSHSSNIAARKGAVDKKRAKNFSKFSKALMSAVRQGGPDADSNLKLKYAIEKARAGNMPKDTIDRAIKKAAADKSGDTFEDLTYEGYAPGGIALIVTCLTDNRNRTAPDIKYIFDRNAGNLGAPGSVSFLFNFRSIVVVERGEKTEDTWVELGLEVGAEDVLVEQDMVTFVSPANDFLALKTALEARSVPLLSAETGYMAQSSIQITEKDEARRVLKLIEALEDNDDVQSVYANYEIPDEWLAELAGS